MRWIEEYEAEEDSKKQSSLQFVILEMLGKVNFRMSSILELYFQIDVALQWISTFYWWWLLSFWSNNLSFFVQAY